MVKLDADASDLHLPVCGTVILQLCVNKHTMDFLYCITQSKLRESNPLTNLLYFYKACIKYIDLYVYCRHWGLCRQTISLEMAWGRSFSLSWPAYWAKTVRCLSQYVQHLGYVWIIYQSAASLRWALTWSTASPLPVWLSHVYLSACFLPGAWCSDCLHLFFTSWKLESFNYYFQLFCDLWVWIY